MVPLPFSIRTAASTAVFACIFIASPQGARTLPTTMPIISALALEYAQLLNLYPQLINQDSANVPATLNPEITSAVTIVGNLVTTLASMNTTIPDNAVLLDHYRIVASNALAMIKNAQSDEDSVE